MQGTFAVPECESTLPPLDFRSLKQEDCEGFFVGYRKKTLGAAY